MDPRDGGLDFVQIVDTPNPSFLALDPTNRYLYATIELGPGQDPVINNGNGAIQRLDDQPGEWEAQPHQRRGFARHVPRAPQRAPVREVPPRVELRYRELPGLRILSDGAIGSLTDNFQDDGNGTGPNPDRQEGPHAHMILTDPGQQHVFGVDLGADKVMAWTLDLGDRQA